MCFICKRPASSENGTGEGDDSFNKPDTASGTTPEAKSPETLPSPGPASVGQPDTTGKTGAPPQSPEIDS